MTSLTSLGKARATARVVACVIARVVAFAVACAVSLAGAAPVAAAQEATGVITGRVEDARTAAPLAGAQVRVLGTALAVATNDAGRFVFRAVPAGIVRLEVRRLGYRPLLRPDVVVSAGKPTEVVIRLETATVELAGIEVRPDAFPALPAPGAVVSTSRFTAEEVRRAPGIQEDVVRAVSVLPGVGVTTGARNDLVVRGGAPFENLFVVDNIEVPNINHFGTQGSSGGPVSLINIDFVEEVQLSAGGFGARHGDRTASVTTLTLREGNRERVATELNVSATGASAIVEGPIGERASFLAGARRSYLDFLFEAAGFGFVPAYADGTLKLAADVSARDRLSFLVVGAEGNVTFNDDDADNRFDNSRVTAPDQRQYFSGVTWRRLLGRGTLTTTLGRVWTTFETVQRDSLDPPQPVFVANTTEGETSLRTDLVLALDPRTDLEAGVIGKHTRVLEAEVLVPGFVRTDALGAPQPLAADTAYTLPRVGGYVQGTRRLGAAVRATLGARLDHYAGFGDAMRFAPRASVSWEAGARTTLSLAAGRYWQAPSALWIAGDVTNEALRPFRADHLVASARLVPRADVKVQVEAYAKRYADYPARIFRPQAVLQPAGFDDVTTDIPFGLEPLASRGTGTAWGVEALVQKALSDIPLYGLVSVSYNRTRFSALTGGEAPGAFDVPLIANALAGWRPNARWELSARLRAASGLPTTPFITTGADAGRQDFTRYNRGERLPVFGALDVRVDRRFQLGRSQLITYLDVQNVTGRENVSRRTWNPRLQAVEDNTSLGVLPSIGLTWEF